MLDKSGARAKMATLLDDLAGLDSLLVAFSGGVDSAFLLASAQEALGDKVTAVTAASPIHPRHEQEEARRFTEKRGIAHIIFESGEMEIPEFLANHPDRCYHCKKALCGEFLRLAGERGINRVAHGANRDDLGDYRPGFRAAEDAGILAPLIDAGLFKDEIRFLAREMGLSQWNRPSMACLASRFPYGNPITEKGLKMVEEAEEFLSSQGFSGIRVRHHGDTARIETGISDLGKMVEARTRKAVVVRLSEIGFTHIAMDLEGHVTGKMNRGIDRIDPHTWVRSG